MMPIDKTGAQQRADQINAFNDELSVLTRDQVIQLSLEQQQAITFYHHGVLQQLRHIIDKFDGK